MNIKYSCSGKVYIYTNTQKASQKASWAGRHWVGPTWLLKPPPYSLACIESKNLPHPHQNHVQVGSSYYDAAPWPDKKIQDTVTASHHSPAKTSGFKAGGEPQARGQTVVAAPGPGCWIDRVINTSLVKNLGLFLKSFHLIVSQRIPRVPLSPPSALGRQMKQLMI